MRYVPNVLRYVLVVCKGLLSSCLASLMQSAFLGSVDFMSRVCAYLLIWLGGYPKSSLKEREKWARLDIPT